MILPRLQSSFLVAASLVSSSVASLSPELQNILQNTHKSNEYAYPTDFTRGIIPVSATSSGRCRVDYWKLTAGYNRSLFIRTSETLIPDAEAR